MRWLPRPFLPLDDSYDRRDCNSPPSIHSSPSWLVIRHRSEGVGRDNKFRGLAIVSFSAGYYCRNYLGDSVASVAPEGVMICSCSDSGGGQKAMPIDKTSAGGVWKCLKTSIAFPAASAESRTMPESETPARYSFSLRQDAKGRITTESSEMKWKQLQEFVG